MTGRNRKKTESTPNITPNGTTNMTSQVNISGSPNRTDTTAAVTTAASSEVLVCMVMFKPLPVK
jgi:hypothetical protein